MGKPTAEQFAQRAFDLGLLNERQLDELWGEFRSKEIPLSQFCDLALRREYLTNYQLERAKRGERSGFFYGDYKVLYLVGTGSFARVFRAVHKKTGDIRALKVLRRRFADDTETKEQFLREGRMGSNLRHENIVPIYDVHSDEKNSFLVMEFIEGQNLRDFVKVRKKLSPADATKLTADIVAGLAYAFKKHITHRDLKLSNALISVDGTAKLVDFGLAASTGKMTEEQLANFPNPRTVDYAGLERCTGVKRGDSRSDTYFAGTMFYHMLSGQSALPETKDRIQRLSVTRFQGVIPIVQLCPSLPRPVANVVTKAMELNPERRYSEPSEMLAELHAVMERMDEFSNAHQVLPDAPKQQSPGQGGSTAGMEGLGHTVMIVESNVNMQNVLRERLKKHGYRVLVISDVERALNRFQDEADAPADCAVFSTNELGEDALDGFNRFGQFTRTQLIPAVLFLAEEHKGFLKRAITSEHRVVVQMPITLKKFRSVLFRLIQKRRLT